jgi:hypothetical protein
MGSVEMRRSYSVKLRANTVYSVVKGKMERWGEREKGRDS